MSRQESNSSNKSYQTWKNGKRNVIDSQATDSKKEDTRQKGKEKQIKEEHNPPGNNQAYYKPHIRRKDEEPFQNNLMYSKAIKCKPDKRNKAIGNYDEKRHQPAMVELEFQRLSSRNLLNLVDNMNQRVNEREIKKYQPIIKKKDFLFRTGIKGCTKMHTYTGAGKDSNKLTNKEEERTYQPILSGREYMSQGRNDKPRLGQRNEEKITKHSHAIQCMRMTNKEGVNRQKGKQFSPILSVAIHKRNNDTQNNPPQRLRNDEKHAINSQTIASKRIISNEEVVNQGDRQRQSIERKLECQRSAAGRSVTEEEEEKKHKSVSGHLGFSYGTCEEAYNKSHKNSIYEKGHSANFLFKHDKTIASKNKPCFQEEVTEGFKHSSKGVVTYERALMRHRASQERRKRIVQQTEIEPVFLDSSNKVFVFQGFTSFTPQQAVKRINSENKISCWFLKKYPYQGVIPNEVMQNYFTIGSRW